MVRPCGNSEIQLTRGSNDSIITSLYALKISADVMIAVLQTALFGFFSDFTTSKITSPLFIQNKILFLHHINIEANQKEKQFQEYASEKN